MVECNGEGKLVTKAHFLHNTKVSSPKLAEDKECKNDGKIQARTLAHTQIFHGALGYP